MSISNSVIFGGPAQRELIRRRFWPKPTEQNFNKFSYEGKGNFFFLPTSNPYKQFELHVNKEIKFYDFKQWVSKFNESGSVWENPGFMDLENMDFRLKPGSPLTRRARELPTVKISRKTLEDMECYFRWLGWLELQK